MPPKASLKNRYIYSFEFLNSKTVYVGLTWNLEKRKIDHLSRKKSLIYKHIETTNEIFIFKKLGYYDTLVAGEKEKEFIIKYKNDEWNILNKSRGGGLGGGIIIWNYTKCKNIALTFNTKKDLRNEYPNVYNVIKNNKWINELCLHMSKLKYDSQYWTFEKCKEEALKYNKRVDFAKNSMYAYNKARKEKWLNIICSHMEKDINLKWSFEKCKELSIGCFTKTDLRRKSQSAYNSALNNKWLDEFFPKYNNYSVPFLSNL